MEVFHGTTLIVETPLVGVGRKNLDFGEGFYLTNIRQQAIDWAQRPINKASLGSEKVIIFSDSIFFHLLKPRCFEV